MKCEEIKQKVTNNPIQALEDEICDELSYLPTTSVNGVAMASFESVVELIRKCFKQKTGEFINPHKISGKLSFREIEMLVQLLHSYDWEYGNDEDRCRELLEATRNKIGYTEADVKAYLSNKPNNP